MEKYRHIVVAAMRTASNANPILEALLESLRQKAAQRFLGGMGPQPDILPELGRRLRSCLNEDVATACNHIVRECASIAKKHGEDARLVRELDRFNFEGYTDALRLYDPLIEKAEYFSDAWEPKYIERWLAFAEATAKPVIRKVGFNLEDALARIVAKYDVSRDFDLEMRDYLDCLT